MHFTIHLYLLNGGNIFGVLYPSVPRPSTSAYISRMEWRCHLRYWRMEQNVFFFDDRILNSIRILRLSRSSVLKCSFVTTQGPPGDIRGFSVLTWVVYSLHEYFFLLLFTTWFTPTTSSKAVTLFLYLQITHTYSKRCTNVMPGLTSETYLLPTQCIYRFGMILTTTNH
jgi:hypothetical protein